MRSRKVHETSLRVVSFTVALAAIPMGATAMSSFLPELGWKVLLVGVCSAVLSVAAVRSALRRADSPKFAALLVFAFTIVAAILNSPLSFSAVCIATVEPEALLFIPVGFVFATVFGSVFAVPLGVIFGATFSVLAVSVYRSCHDPALEAPEQTLRSCGAWLFLVGSSCYLVSRMFHSGTALDPMVVSGVQTLSTSIAIVGAAASAFAHEALWTRRCWLRQVRLGLRPGWDVVELDGFTQESLKSLQPLLSSTQPLRHVLVRRRPGIERGAYRTGDQIEPIAKV